MPSIHPQMKDGMPSVGSHPAQRRLTAVAAEHGESTAPIRWRAGDEDISVTVLPLRAITLNRQQL